MTLSYQQAIDQLATLRASNNLNETTLRNLVSALDVTAPGSVTVLFAGSIGGIPAIDIAENMKDDSNIRIISKTDASQFLDFRTNKEFRTALQEVFLTDPEEIGSSAFKFLNGDRDATTGIRTANGAWDIVSANFAQATTGKVKILSEVPGSYSVLLQTELPILLEKLKSGTDITEICGITREQLLLKFSDTTDLRNAIMMRALQEAVFTKPSVSNHSGFLSLSDEAFGNLLKTASSEDLAKLTQFTAQFPLSRAALNALPKLGIGFAAMGLILVSLQASEAHAAGRPEEARRMLEEYAAATAGSTTGQAAGALLAGIGLALAGAAGVTIAAPVALGAVLVASVAGGFFGGEWGEDLYDLFHDRSAEQGRDLAQRLLRLLFGEDYSLDMPIPAGLLDSGKLTLDTHLSREALVAHARDDIAWRYALRELNSFVVEGDALYERHNRDGSLNLDDPAADTPGMSALYLQDRAAMLAWKLKFEHDKHPYDKPYESDEVAGNWDYVDLSAPDGHAFTLSIDGTGLSLHDHQIVFGGASANYLQGAGASDHLYGMAGNDRLEGGAGDDYLEGGAGNDTLRGGTGNDTLYGGTGFDIYVFEGEDGQDTIMDRRGAIVVDGQVLTGGKRKPGELSYVSADERHVYRLSEGDLIIDETLRIKGFENRQLNLYLDDEVKEPEPPDYDPNAARREPVRVDPLVLDLNHDGEINTVALADSRAYFDFNGDGIAEKTGWIAPGDGIVVLDRNGNGVIDGLGEAFGKPEINGFEDLRATLDENRDGRIDARDAGFEDLRLWQDHNQDGVSQSAELKRLRELGISAIELTYEAAAHAHQGNLISALGSFTQHGQRYLAADVDLAVDHARTDSNPQRVHGGDALAGLDEEIFGLPWLRGFGAVADLPQAYRTDADLRAFVKGLIAAGPAQAQAQFDRLLALWSGLERLHLNQGVAPTRLNLQDKAWMLETFVGLNTLKSRFEAADESGRPLDLGQGRVLNEPYVQAQFERLRSRYQIAFMAQAFFKEALRGCDYSLASDAFIAQDAKALSAGFARHVKSIDDANQAALAAQVLLRLRQDGVQIDGELFKQELGSAPHAQLMLDMLNARYDDVSLYNARYFGGEGGSYIVATAQVDELPVTPRETRAHCTTASVAAPIKNSLLGLPISRLASGLHIERRSRCERTKKTAAARHLRSSPTSASARAEIRRVRADSRSRISLKSALLADVHPRPSLHKKNSLIFCQ